MGRGPNGSISVPIAAAVHAVCADCAGGIGAALVAIVGGEDDEESDVDDGEEEERKNENGGWPMSNGVPSGS